MASLRDHALESLRYHARRLAAERQWRQTRVDNAARNVRDAEVLAARWPGTLIGEYHEDRLRGAVAYLATRQRELDDHDAEIVAAQLAVASHEAQYPTPTQETIPC